MGVALILSVSLPVRTQGQFWGSLWNSISSAFDDVEKQAKDMLNQTVNIGGQAIDLGSNAVGAATEVAMNAKTSTYGAAKALNAKAFVYFREAVPIPQIWDVMEKISQNNFEGYEKLEESRNVSMKYGANISKKMVEAAISGDWEWIWTFANGYTGYMSIVPKPECPRPIMAAIFVYDPKTEKVRTVSINPNLEEGSLTYVYAAPRVTQGYKLATGSNDVNPYDLFIAAVGQVDLKTKKVIWDYSGPTPVLQKSRWKVGFKDGKFDSQIVADDDDLDSPQRQATADRNKTTAPPADKPSSINADMYTPDLPYCRDLNGEYSFPVNKGKIINFGDIVTLESVQYKYYLDADDNYCTPLGILPGNDKQWIIIDPNDPIKCIGKPVPQQYKFALRSVSKDRNLDADGDCVTPNGDGYGQDKIWWAVQPDWPGQEKDPYLRSGHVLGIKNWWLNRFLDADDDRCTGLGNDLAGWDKQWRIQLLSAKPVPYGQESDHPDRHTISVMNNTNENWIVDLTLRPQVGFGRPFYNDPNPKMPWPLPASALGQDTLVNYFPVVREFSRWAKELAPQGQGGISCYGVPREQKNRMFVHFSAWLKSTGKMVWDVYFDEAAGDHILLEFEGSKAWFHCGNIHYWTFETGK